MKSDYERYPWLYINPKFPYATNLDETTHRLKLGQVHVVIGETERVGTKMWKKIRFNIGGETIKEYATKNPVNFEWINGRIKEFFNSKEYDDVVKEDGDVAFSVLEKWYRMAKKGQLDIKREINLTKNI